MDIDPTLIYLLVAVGLMGVGIELLTPGGFVPALLGTAAFVVGVVAATDKPVDAVGVALIGLAVALFVADAALGTRRLLGAGGVIALVLGGIFFFDRGQAATSIPAVIVAGLVLGGFMMFVIERAAGVRSQPVRTGSEELVGATAEVRSDLDPLGQVFVEGSLWRARMAGGAKPARTGQAVTVEAVDGLTLTVRPLPDRGPENVSPDKE